MTVTELLDALQHVEAAGGGERTVTIVGEHSQHYDVSDHRGEPVEAGLLYPDTAFIYLTLRKESTS